MTESKAQTFFHELGFPQAQDGGATALERLARVEEWSALLERTDLICAG